MWSGARAKLRRMGALMGPAFLVSVAYMDPGNWATAIEAGSRFGYQLVWVVVLANLVAILLQTLAARLGLVTGKHLAQVCRESYPPVVCALLWVLCEVSIVALDLTMVLGTAVGLNLLLGWPMLPCILATSLDALLLLLLVPRHGVRTSEAVTVGLVMAVVGCFMVDLLLSQPPLGAVLRGLLVPRLPADAVYVAVCLLGANVMPHNLILHSALVCGQRAASPATTSTSQLCRYNFMDIAAALGLALVVNVAVLLVAAATFHHAGIVVGTLQEAHDLMESLLSSRLAPAAFGTALLAAGQLSTFTGTIAGQVVLRGFMNTSVPTWLRRLLTRGAAVLPAALLQALGGDRASYKFLLIAQVVLALQLPFVLVPLIKATSSRALMGRHRNSAALSAAAWGSLGLVFVANAGLFVSELWPGTDLVPGVTHASPDSTLHQYVDNLAALAWSQPGRFAAVVALLVGASLLLGLQLWVVVTPLNITPPARPLPTAHHHKSSAGSSDAAEAAGAAAHQHGHAAGSPGSGRRAAQCDAARHHRIVVAPGGEAEAQAAAALHPAAAAAAASAAGRPVVLGWAVPGVREWLMAATLASSSSGPAGAASSSSSSSPRSHHQRLQQQQLGWAGSPLQDEEQAPLLLPPPCPSWRSSDLDVQDAAAAAAAAAVSSLLADSDTASEEGGAASTASCASPAARGTSRHVAVPPPGAAAPGPCSSRAVSGAASVTSDSTAVSAVSSAASSQAAVGGGLSKSGRRALAAVLEGFWAAYFDRHGTWLMAGSSDAAATSQPAAVSRTAARSQSCRCHRCGAALPAGNTSSSGGPAATWAGVWCGRCCVGLLLHVQDATQQLLAIPGAARVLMLTEPLPTGGQQQQQQQQQQPLRLAADPPASGTAAVVTLLQDVRAQLPARMRQHLQLLLPAAAQHRLLSQLGVQSAQLPAGRPQQHPSADGAMPPQQQQPSSSSSSSSLRTALPASTQTSAAQAAPGIDVASVSAILLSWGMWCLVVLLALAQVEVRPELWGRYAAVLNRLQGLLPTLDSQHAWSGSTAGAPPLRQLASGAHAHTATLAHAERYQLQALLLGLLAQVEGAAGGRGAPTAAAAAGVGGAAGAAPAFARGKEILISVVKRYRRRLLQGQGQQQQQQQQQQPHAPSSPLSRRGGGLGPGSRRGSGSRGGARGRMLAGGALLAGWFVGVLGLEAAGVRAARPLRV